MHNGDVNCVAIVYDSGNVEEVFDVDERTVSKRGLVDVGWNVVRGGWEVEGYRKPVGASSFIAVIGPIN